MNATARQPGMFEEEIQDLFDRYVEVWNTGQVEHFDELTTEDFDLRIVSVPAPITGREGLKAFIRGQSARYPDFHLAIREERRAGENTYLIQWTVTATRSVADDVPTAGRKVCVDGFSVIFLRDGKVAGEWISYSDVEWMTQLGYSLVPPVKERAEHAPPSDTAAHFRVE